MKHGLDHWTLGPLDYFFWTIIFGPFFFFGLLFLDHFIYYQRGERQTISTQRGMGYNIQSISTQARVGSRLLLLWEGWETIITQGGVALWRHFSFT